MKFFPFSHNQKGNAILISLGVTSFMFVVAAGAGSLIDSSLRQSPKIVNSGKAFYAAEAAVESALFEASGRTSGYETSISPTIDMEHLNKTQASYSASSREDIKRTRNEGNANDRTMYIPPRTVTKTSGDEFDIVDLDKNWKKVKFGQAYSFDLFVDDSDKFLGTNIGDATTAITFTTNQCEPVVAYSSGIFTECTDEDSLAHHIPDVTVSCTNEGNTGPPDYMTKVACTLDPLAPNDGRTCDQTGEVLDPNGICSSETTSIFDDEYGNTNTGITDIFFDVYVPAKEPVDVNDDDIATIPVLSWSLEAKTDPDYDTSLPDILELKSTNDCDEENSFHPGAICMKDFDQSGVIPIGITQKEDGNSTWVRLSNPTGIIKGSEHIIRSSIQNFGRKNISYSEGTITENITPSRLYFPKLTVQMGPKQEWWIDSISGTKKYISEAYIRIGFRYSNDAYIANPDIISEFPVPSDKTTIQATGSADGFTQRINVEIEPQEIAPMFEYAVFQP